MHVWLALAAPPSAEVQGIAHDVDAGAVVVGPAGETTRIDGLLSWPEALRGLPVTASGRRPADPAAPHDLLVEAVVQAAPWELSFSDGSQNLTLVTRTAASTSWTYRPIQPHESSSGHYSGGEPGQGPLSAEASRELWRRATALLDDPTVQVERREMGTGRLALTAPWGTREALLSARATAELGGWVAGLRRP